MSTITHLRVPQYCHQKSRGTAFVRLDGQRHYLPGPFGSPQSKAEYARLVGSWMSNGRTLGTSLPSPALVMTATAALQPSSPIGPSASLTVARFVLLYLKYAQVRYAKNGHFCAVKAAFIPMVKLFRDTAIMDFGPKRFKEVREVFIARKMVRREINRRMHWIRNGVRWAVAEELIPGEVLHRLVAVDILRRDEAAVPEPTKVQPVDEDLVMKTIAHALPEVAAMARIQLLTAARSGEVVLMRGRSIDMSRSVWLYRPEKHKTQYRGHDRVIPIGLRAQEIIKPFLLNDPDGYLFSPARADERRRQVAHEARKTPHGNGNNLGTNRTEKPERCPGERYTSGSYGRAVTRAIEVAFPLPAHLQAHIIVPTKGRKHRPRPETRREWWARLTEEQQAEVKAWWKQHHWHPHQLRHNCGTAIRDAYGPDFAQALLGHASLSATEIYAGVQMSKAVDVMRKVG